MTKWPPPPDHPMRAPSGWPLRTSERIRAIVAVPPDQLARLPVRVSALSRYHGWLHCDVEPLWQQVDWPSSALTTVHWVPDAPEVGLLAAAFTRLDRDRPRALAFAELRAALHADPVALGEALLEGVQRECLIPHAGPLGAATKP